MAKEISVHDFKTCFELSRVLWQTESKHIHNIIIVQDRSALPAGNREELCCSSPSSAWFCHEVSARKKEQYKTWVRQVSARKKERYKTWFRQVSD